MIQIPSTFRLFRSWAAGSAALALFGAARLLAAPDMWFVADHKDDGPYMTGSGSGNTGDLRYCIVQSNNSTNPEGSIINIYDYPTVTRGMLPITRTVTIRSDPNLAPQIYAVNGGYLGRVFFIDAPPSHVVRISNLNIRNSRANGGAGGAGAGGGAGLGGAIFVNSGQLIVENVYFEDIGAVGGPGGNHTFSFPGGGGGLGGNGGGNGGGGGGFRGNGGNGGNNAPAGNAGGGGGGIIGNGGAGFAGSVGQQYAGGGGGGTVNGSGESGGGGGGNGGQGSGGGFDGALYGGGGGAGPATPPPSPPTSNRGGTGGKFGGGGGGSSFTNSAGGIGGDFGGGGGATSTGGPGGYGGGGGGSKDAGGGPGGFGGGNGASTGSGGSGGSAYGGVIFVRGSTGEGPVTILQNDLPAGIAWGGAGGTASGSTGTNPGAPGQSGGTSIYQEALNGAEPPPLIFDTSVDRTVAGTIGSSSTGNITLRKRGAGRLLFATPHQYFGYTVIEQGTLRLAPGGGNLGTSLASVDGTLDLNGNNITLRGLTSAGGSGVVTTTTTGSNLTVTLESNGLTTEYGGSLTDGPGGTLSLVKTGTSVQQLSGQNVFTGGTTVNFGQLRTGAPNTPFGAIGRGSVTINAGEILVLGSNSFMGFNTTSLPGRTVRINAGGTLRAAAGTSSHLVALVLAGGTLASNGPETTFGNWNFDRGVSTPGGGSVSNITGGNATLNQAGGTVFNIGNGDTLNISTVLDQLMGSTGLRKTGPGALVLNGFNTYTSGTSVEAGRLTLGVGSNVGAIRGTLTLAAGTTLESTAANSFGFSAGLKVDAVTLNNATLLHTGAGDLGWGVAYTLNGGTMSSNSGQTSTTAASKFSFGNSVGTPTSVLAQAGSTTTIQGRLDLRSDGGGTGTVFTVETGATLHIPAAVTTSVAAQILTKAGPGTLTLTAANTYAGQTVLQGGVLGIGSATALGTSTVRFNGGQLRYLGVNPDISANLTTNGTGATSIDTNGQNVTFATPIGGTNGLTKAGAGTLILSAANTYSGTTSLAGGNLGYANAGSFGTSRLTFNGGTLQYFGLSTDLSPLFNAGGSGPVSVDTNGQNVTFGSPLNNTFGLTKAGTGRLELGAANPSLAGTVTLAGGSLRLSAASQLGSARITFAGGTLAYAPGFTTDLSPLINTPSTATYSIDPGGQTVTFGTALSGSAGLTKVGTGTLVLAANNAINGATTIQGGTLQVGNGGSSGAIGATTGIVNNGALVYARSSGSISQSGVMSGTGSFTVGGGVVLSISGAHTYTGPTVVTGGSNLILSGAVSLYNLGHVAGSSITVEAGSSLVFDGNDILDNYNNTPSTVLIAQTGALVRNTGVFNTLNDLTLNGAELRASGGANPDLPAYLIRGTVTVGGSTPSFITATSTVNANDLVNLGPLTTFAVADVTSSPAADLTISARLKDNYQATEPTAGTLRKTGPGTLLLTAVNTYGGQTFVDVGTLALGASATAGVGPITVASGAKFDVNALGTTGFTLASGRTLTNHGTIQGVLAVSGNYLGNGALQGGLTVNPGATVERTSGSLTVTGTITNHGTLRFRNGAVLDASGVTSIVNHGVIDLITAGPTTSFSAVALSGSGIFLPPGGVAVKDVARAGNAVTVKVDGFTGHTYQLQRSTSLSSGSFVNVGAAQPGTGTTAPAELTFTDASAPAGPVFYRVLVTG